MRSRNQCWTLLAVVMVVAAFTAVTSANRTDPRPANDPGLYNVKTFGAKADGKTIDTPAINKAIDAAAAAGGGTVFFPAGNYLSVSIHLKSNIALYLDQGATIVAANTSSAAKYDPPEPNQWDAYQDFGHTHWHNSLIWGENLTNVSIVGPGLIYGKGLTRWGPGPRRPTQPGDSPISLDVEPRTGSGTETSTQVVMSAYG